MKKTIQEILQDRIPADLTDPIVISVEEVKDSNFSTMPDGATLVIDRGNHAVGVEREGEDVNLFVEAGIEFGEYGAAFEAVIGKKWPANVPPRPKPSYAPRVIMPFPISMRAEVPLSHVLRIIDAQMKNALAIIVEMAKQAKFVAPNDEATEEDPVEPNRR